MRLRQRVPAIGVDVPLAAAMTILLQVELWAGERYQGAPAFPGAKAATAPFLLVATVALAWRRRRPTAAVVLVMATLALQSTVTGGPEAGGEFALILVALYSAAAYGARLIVTLLATAIALTAHGLNDPFIHNLGDATFSLLFALVGLGLGRAMHGRGVRARVLAGEAERLRRERDTRAEQAVAEERARIARELHDIVAHSVSVMVLQSLAGQSVLEHEEPRARQTFMTIEKTGRQAMEELRRLLALLREDLGVPAAPQPGLADLAALADEMREVGLDVALTRGDESAEVPPGVGLTAYRIVQEALTNSLKHSGPGQAEVDVAIDGHELRLRVRDHGSYVEPVGGAWGAGHGLVGMRERAELYGGQLTAGQAPSGGFLIEARLPLGRNGAA